MVAARNPTAAVLLAALHPEAAAFGPRFARYCGRLDWDLLLERAAAHKVEALLASRVETAGTAPVPVAVRDRLRAARERAADRHATALRDLAVVDRCLDRAGIPYVLVKGPVLTQWVYEHPGQRHYFDLDLVVHRRQVDAAQEALEALGYRLWGGDRYLGFTPDGPAALRRATRLMRDAFIWSAHELSFVTEDRRLLPLDLHWQLMPPGRIRAAAADALWEHATFATLGDVRARVLDAESMLLHLAMHAWSNRPWTFALLHLCDVAWAVHRLPVDAERLWALADRWGGRGDLARALYAVEVGLGVTPPASLRRPRRARLTDGVFRRIATAETLLERHARPTPRGWARWRRDLEWGLAMGSMRSTATWLAGKHTARLRYRLGGGA